MANFGTIKLINKANMKIPSDRFEVRNLTLTGDPAFLNDLYKVLPQVGKMFHQLREQLMVEKSLPLHHTP
jgi:hypothetical protein